MPAVDLERFTIDCRIKEQQVRLLQSMRTTPDDRLVNYLGNLQRPWTRYTDPGSWNQRDQVYSGRSNWLINQHLMTLARNCP